MIWKPLIHSQGVLSFLKRLFSAGTAWCRTLALTFNPFQLCLKEFEILQFNLFFSESLDIHCQGFGGFSLKIIFGHLGTLNRRCLHEHFTVDI